MKGSVKTPFLIDINIDVKEKNISEIISGRWNWYGIGEGPEEEMIQFDDILHTFINGNRKAEVGVRAGVFGLRMWENQIWQKDELYENHSEAYAEDAADNYVFGIKN